MTKEAAKLAITGGIGAGKSFVSSLFETLGIPVYNADTEAKRLMNSDRNLKAAIKQLLGNEAYHKNGRLNRKYLASRVFESSNILTALNRIVHPAVRQDFDSWSQNQKAEYVLKESAIVFEADLAKYFKAVILVVADRDTRIERIIDRDATIKEAVISRMNNQWPDDRKIPLADYIINNDGAESLVKQVHSIHRSILDNLNQEK